MIVIAGFFCIFYLILLLYFLNGWLKLKTFIATKSTPNLKFSIIVPARNEKSNILKTLEDLTSQNYPNELYEIILVDDDSQDNTFSLVKDYLEKTPPNNIRLYNTTDKSTQSALKYKKGAIELGISLSSFDWIITTDADCRRGNQWLKTIASFIEINQPFLVSAPVMFYEEKNIFQKMQSLEFLSLVGIGASSMANHSPNLCNGANLAYKKEVFIEVNGFTGNENLASGDDEFLMHKIAKKYPDRVMFLKSMEALVLTKPNPTLNDFINQRKRWVSKSTHYSGVSVRFTLLLVWAFHLLILISAALAIFLNHFLLPLLLLLLTKFIAELIFITPITRYFKKVSLLKYYIPSAILYVFYVVLIAFLGNSGTYNWKGRKIK